MDKETKDLIGQLSLKIDELQRRVEALQVSLQVYKKATVKERK